MRTALISDMHGNAVAFDAVLADLAREPVDQVVCLGDAIQGGPQPAETVARLRELACPVVMGNADDLLLNGDDGAEPLTDEITEVAAWTVARLSDADRAFMTGFQPTVELPLGGSASLLAFHASPQSFNDLILPDTPDDEVARLLGPHTATILAGGHTHLQQLRRLNGARFVNPGSIGRAFNARSTDPEDATNPRVDPWAEYAILTAHADGRLNIDFRRVPYDVPTLLGVLRQSGMPHADTFAARYRA